MGSQVPGARTVPAPRCCRAWLTRGFFLAATSCSERLSQLERSVGTWRGRKEEEEGWGGGGIDNSGVSQMRQLTDRTISAKLSLFADNKHREMKANNEQYCCN